MRSPSKGDGAVPSAPSAASSAIVPPTTRSDPVNPGRPVPSTMVAPRIRNESPPSGAGAWAPSPQAGSRSAKAKRTFFPLIKRPPPPVPAPPSELRDCPGIPTREALPETRARRCSSTYGRSRTCDTRPCSEGARRAVVACVDRIESCVDFLEPLVYSVEPLFHTIKARVDPVESRVHAVEPPHNLGRTMYRRECQGNRSLVIWPLRPGCRRLTPERAGNHGNMGQRYGAVFKPSTLDPYLAPIRDASIGALKSAVDAHRVRVVVAPAKQR